MVAGRLPLFNPDPIDFMDDLLEKDIEIPTDLSPALQYPCPAALWPFTLGTCCDASSRRTPPSASPWTRFLWGRRRGLMCRRTSG